MKKIKKGLVALLLAAQIGFVGCSDKGGAQVTHHKSNFSGRDDCMTIYDPPQKGLFYNINNYGCDKTIDEIVVHKDGRIKVYVNKDTKGRYPDVDRFRKTWHDKEIEEVDNKRMNQIAGEIGYK